MVNLGLFREREPRTRLVFLLAVVVLFLFGLSLPVPGVDHAALGRTLGFTGPLATLSGGALPRLSVFALGIYPYLTAMLIMNIGVAAIPRLGSMATGGGRDAERVLRYGRVLTAVLAVLEATAVIAYAATVAPVTPNGPRLLAVHGFLPLATMAVCLAAGAVLVMWLAEILDVHAFGKGTAILLATQVAAVLPKEFWGISRSKGAGTFTLALVVVLATVVFKVCFDGAQRRIPLRAASTRVTAARRHTPVQVFFPLKLGRPETAIYDATAVLLLPVLAVQLWPGIGWLRDIQPYLHDESDPWYLAAFEALIVVFTFVEIWVALNPGERADQLKRDAMFVPGYRPGTATRQYLSYVLARIAPASAFYLAVSALIPILGFAMLGADAAFPYGGEAVVLILTVSLDTVTSMSEQVAAARPVEGFFA